MDVGGYRHNYEGFYEKTSFQMSINSLEAIGSKIFKRFGVEIS